MKTPPARLTSPLIRSLLYVPASSDRFIAKAHERGADAIILDLEDSVAPHEKEKARSRLASAVPAVTRNGALAFVRTNPGVPLLADAEAACRAGAFGLLITKVQTPDELQHLARYLDTIEKAIGRARPTVFIPLLEDPGAVLDARAIATASPRILGLITGADDLATEMGAQPTPDLLRLPMMIVHLAAKAAGVCSYGMLLGQADFRDAAGLERAAREARALGFDGASCIHPDAIGILNRAFAPSPEEMEHATRLIRAYEESLAAGRGACVFEGKMIDVPIVKRARALLARFSGRTQP